MSLKSLTPSRPKAARSANSMNYSGRTGTNGKKTHGRAGDTVRGHVLGNRNGTKAAHSAAAALRPPGRNDRGRDRLRARHTRFNPFPSPRKAEKRGPHHRPEGKPVPPLFGEHRVPEGVARFPL